MEYEYFTKEGLEKLKNEVHELKYRKRPEISAKIGAARELGDLKENAEYHAAREELSLLETKIQILEDRIARSRIIEKEDLPTDKVYILSTVELKDLDRDEKLEYTLVAASDADYKQNKLSIASPIGKALLGKAVGDIVEVAVPAGTLRYEVLSIRR